MGTNTAPYVRYGRQRPQNNAKPLRFILHRASSKTEFEDKLLERNYDAYIIAPSDCWQTIHEYLSLIPSQYRHVLIAECENDILSDIPLRKVKKAKLKADITIDFDTQIVTHSNGEHKLLRGSTLSKLLNHLLSNNGTFLSRQSLLKSHIWSNSVGPYLDDDSHVINMSLSRLRKLVEPDPKKQKIIINFRGIGWMIPNDVIVSIEYYDK